MNIAICEDNAAEAAQIRSLLLDHFEREGYVGDIALFESAEALLSAFVPGAFDAIFLDIYMNGMSGMEAARKIRETDSHCALVFVTASMKHSLEAFSVFATTYVLKPITSEAMDAAFARYRGVFIKSVRYIEVTSERQKFKFPLNRIQYVEMDGKSAVFHTPLGSIKTHLTLDDVEARLGGGPFLRCHRAFIVNMNHVESVLEQDILMRGGALVPISRRAKAEIRSVYGMLGCVKTQFQD